MALEKKGLLKDWNFIALAICGGLMIVCIGLLIYLNAKAKWESANMRQLNTNNEQRPIPPIDWGMAGTVKDYTGIDEYDNGFWEFLGHISRFVKTGELDKKGVSIVDSYGDCVKNPEKYRGSYVRVRGTVMWSTPVRLTKEGNYTNLDMLYRYYITPDLADTAYICDSAEPPSVPVKSVKENGEYEADIIDVDGIFYKITRYESATNIERKVPYILAKNIRVINKGTAKKTLGEYGSVMIGCAILCFAVATFVILKPLFSRPAPPIYRSTTFIGGKR